MVKVWRFTSIVWKALPVIPHKFFMANTAFLTRSASFCRHKCVWCNKFCRFYDGIGHSVYCGRGKYYHIYTVCWEAQGEPFSAGKMEAKCNLRIDKCNLHWIQHNREMALGGGSISSSYFPSDLLCLDIFLCSEMVNAIIFPYLYESHKRLMALVCKLT